MAMIYLDQLHHRVDHALSMPSPSIIFVISTTSSPTKSVRQGTPDQPKPPNTNQSEIFLLLATEPSTSVYTPQNKLHETGSALFSECMWKLTSNHPHFLGHVHSRQNLIRHATSGLRGDAYLAYSASFGFFMILRLSEHSREK